MSVLGSDSIHVSYVAGGWVSPSAGAHRIDVVDPTSEAVIGAVLSADDAVVDDAVGSAAQAFDGWSRLAPRERGELLAALAGKISEHEDELADIIVHEVGSPVRIAQRIQARLPSEDLRVCAEIASAPGPDETIGHSLIVREAAGVVGAITPWNYPLHQFTCKVGPALAAGCTVVLKPSEVAPLAVSRVFDLIHEVGFPPGVVNLVHGTGPAVGERLVSHPAIRVVSFTGSAAAGSRVAGISSAMVKRVVLELGGKSASVVLDDADLETAVKVSVSNAFLNGGQTCSAWTRLLVPAQLHDRASELAATAAAKLRVGDPADPETRIGPLASAAQYEKVRSRIEDGIASSAELVCGGLERPAGLDRGYFVQPTVFASVDPRSEIAQEEIFGPVLCVIPFDDDDDALRIANGTPYGLHGAVWSGNVDRAVGIARRLRAGQVDINGAAHNPAAPFGGYAKSGIGRESGRYGMSEYLEVKAIQR